MPETAQTAPETNEKKSRGLGSYLVWTLVVILVYVLSSGPMSRLARAGLLTPRAYDVVYWPLERAYWGTPLHHPLGVYLHLWRSDLFDKKGELITYPQVYDPNVNF